MRDDNMEISNAGRTEREKNKCVLLYQRTMCGSQLPRFSQYYNCAIQNYYLNVEYTFLMVL